METPLLSLSTSCFSSFMLNCSPFTIEASLRNEHFGHRSFFKIKSSTMSPQIEISRPPPLKQKSAAFRAKRRKKRFKEEDAYPYSIPLHKKNPNAIFKDAQTFARQNDIRAALTILDYLDRQGIPVNVTTFSSLIAACIRLKSLAHAKQIHAFIKMNGLENNEFLRIKIVQMYASCGSFDDARKVLDGCMCSSVYPWNALLRGSVISGGRSCEDVLYVYSRMRELGVELNVYSFSCLIKSLAGAVALKQGLKLHGVLIKNGLIGSSVLATSLIDMYFKCGKINMACHVFEEFSERDIVVWGAMIAGFAHNGLQREALKYVRLMREEGLDPNSVVLTTILPVIGEVGAWKLGKEVHAYIIKTESYWRQLFIQSALIDMYCKCRDLNSGRRVFYSSRERSSVSWTALMSGYATNGQLQQAMRAIMWMQQEGFRPDVVTVATLLPVCAKLADVKRGREIHSYLVKNHMLPNVSLTTSLMVMYSKCGCLDYSRTLFSSMDRKNVISWTAMIDSLSENGCLYEALDLFRLMQLSKHSPDSVTILRVLSICNKIGMVKHGKEIHGQVLKKGFEYIPFISAEIISMYGRCGLINKAKLMFDFIPLQGPVIQTAMIDAYGYNGHYQDAITRFDEMMSAGFTPNPVTFNRVLSICDQAGLADEACRIFRLMTARFGIKSCKEHYSIVIRLLTRIGRVEEAEKYIQRSSSLA
ncbi:hypothetical protein Ancab_012572 [Ancistrocladus abbreviatus]